MSVFLLIFFITQFGCTDIRHTISTHYRLLRWRDISIALSCIKIVGIDHWWTVRGIVGSWPATGGIRGTASPWARDESNSSARLGVNENGHLLSPGTRGERAPAMADYSNVAPPSSNAPAGMNDAFKDALQRARQVYASLFFFHHLRLRSWVCKWCFFTAWKGPRQLTC